MSPQKEQALIFDDSFLDSIKFPEVAKACKRCGIKTYVQLAEEAAIQAEKFFPNFDKNKANPRNLIAYLSKTREPQNNIWHAGQRRYKTIGVCIGIVLGLHPRFLFGSSLSLKITQSRIVSHPNPQRDRIKKALKKTYNPLTKEEGISSDDFQNNGFASTKEGQNTQLCYATASSSNKKIRNFRTHDFTLGEAREWALDLATLIDEPVETLFQEGIDRLQERCARSDGKHNFHVNAVEMGRALYPFPMQNPEHLNEARHIQNPNLDLEKNFYDQELKNILLKALKALKPSEQKIMMSRLISEETLKEAGKRIGVSKQRAKQIEEKATQKLKKKVDFYLNS